MRGGAAELPNRGGVACLGSGATRRVGVRRGCSAAFYLDNDPGVLISACLFGDGAGAVVWSARPTAHVRRVEWTAADTILSPGDREALRFEQRDGMLRNILSREVPALAARHVGRLFQTMAGRHGVGRREVTGWVLHAGT